VDERTPGIRPRPTFARRLDAAARSAFPFGLAVLLLLLSAAPLGLPAEAELQQAVTLASVFFWSLFRPASMPPPAVFLLGLLMDLLGLAPIGTGIVTLLIVHGVALRLRRALVPQGFVLVWLAFIGVAAGAALLGWALGSVLVFRLLPPLAGVFQFALAAALYPVLAMVFTRAHRSVADPGRA
jgi:rod shape-determining protein MreD